MLKNALLSCSVLFATWLSAQSLSPATVSSGGGFQTKSSGSLSFTIGQAVITTLKKDSSILTQGFQQGTMKKKTSVLSLDAGSVNIEMYPSPASTYLEFHIESKTAAKVAIAIYDVLGNKICDVQDIQASGLDHHAVHGTAGLSDAVYVAYISITDASGSTQYISRRFVINN